MKNKKILILVFVIIIAIAMGVVYLTNMNNTNSDINNDVAQNADENADLFAGTGTSYLLYELSDYRKATVDNIWNNYEDPVALEKYTPLGYEGMSGDRAVIQVVDTNYKQYDNKEAPMEKYSEPITMRIANIHENVLDYGLTLDEMLAIQPTANTYTNEKIGSEGFYKITGMLIINGNDESEEAWQENARAKTIKVTVDDTEEFTYELKDEVKAQLIDLEYTHNSLATPINVKIEVLDTYNGAKSTDVYISDIKFGTEQSFNGGR